MGDQLSIRRARIDDAPSVQLLVEEAVRWLGATGFDQWQTPGFASLNRIERAIDAGELWVIHDAAALISTATLNSYADPEFWTPSDDPATALYLHRVVVRRACAGRGIGAAVLDWAGEQALAADLPLLRLDAWANNVQLHKYYLGQGFHLVRTLTLPHRGSGALFERSARYRTRRGPDLTRSANSAPA